MSSVYVITGGTDGIGKGIVKKILQGSAEDDRVIVNYGHNDKKAKDFFESLCDEEKQKVTLIKADLAEYKTMMEFVDKIKITTGTVDYLICNIGISEYAKFDDYTLDMWNRVMNTNLTMPTFLIKEIKDIINPGGSILLMGSYAGKKEYSSSVVYSISKAGILFLAKVLVKELESNQIRINAIAPGFIETSWQNSRSDESRERINRKIAMHRFGEPDEVGDIAYSVLKNGYMNGAIIDIHGGYEYF